jgi:hypothetical protein
MPLPLYSLVFTSLIAIVYHISHIVYHILKFHTINDIFIISFDIVYEIITKKISLKYLRLIFNATYL